MAHIVRFEIEGLAGRTKPYSATLNRDFNVFFGLNGSGKTTLLKILHSALSTDTEVLRDLPFKHAEVEIYINNHQRAFKRSFSQPDPVDALGVLSMVSTIHAPSEVYYRWLGANMEAATDAGMSKGLKFSNKGASCKIPRPR